MAHYPKINWNSQSVTLTTDMYSVHGTVFTSFFSCTTTLTRSMTHWYTLSSERSSSAVGAGWQRDKAVIHDSTLKMMISHPKYYNTQVALIELWMNLHWRFTWRIMQIISPDWPRRKCVSMCTLCRYLHGNSWGLFRRLLRFICNLV